jgi:hypothetical protein
LTDDELDRFVRDGAVLLKGAFSSELAVECRRRLWAATGCDEHDPTTWTRPVIRIEYRADAPFAAAVNTARLRAAFDQLAGPGRWLPRSTLGTSPNRSDPSGRPAVAGRRGRASGTLHVTARRPNVRTPAGAEPLEVVMRARPVAGPNGPVALLEALRSSSPASSRTRLSGREDCVGAGFAAVVGCGPASQSGPDERHSGHGD